MSEPFVDSLLPENESVLRYLRARNERDSPLVARPDASEQPYLGLGSHPDIVERVWDGLGARLPGSARCVVLGCPALSDPGSGVILALALGTAYALRVPAGARVEALAAGLQDTYAYNAPAKTVDAATTFGPDWLFGAFDRREPAWVATASGEQLLDQLNRLRSPRAR